MSDNPPRRETKAFEPRVVDDPIEAARLEARNGLIQAYQGEQMALAAIERGNFRLRALTFCPCIELRFRD
jgi:hypothetical protein